MSILKKILNAKEGLLDNYRELVKPEDRTWMNWQWRTAMGLERAIKAINMLIPHEEEFLKLNEGREICSIGLHTTGRGEYIEAETCDNKGVFNYSYYMVNDGRLTVAFDGGNCESAFKEVAK